MLHPGIRGQVEMDLMLMKAGSWLLHCLPGLKWLSLFEIVEEFEKLMTKQVGLFRLHHTALDLLAFLYRPEFRLVESFQVM